TINGNHLKAIPGVSGSLDRTTARPTHQQRRTHLTAGLRRYEAEHDWLTTVRLPAYAPDLNPVEAVWSLVRRAMANTAFGTPDDLDRILRRELPRIQLQPRLIDGCLAATHLTLALPTPP
ncbi:transposase, partial [Streptomyces vinaceus]|uniref:transposase n=1 Tax=Streptomyces vinaceus TaxID=1960 RepID=UPI00380F425B